MAPTVSRSRLGPLARDSAKNIQSFCFVVKYIRHQFATSCPSLSPHNPPVTPIPALVAGGTSVLTARTRQPWTAGSPKISTIFFRAGRTESRAGSTCAATEPEDTLFRLLLAANLGGALASQMRVGQSQQGGRGGLDSLFFFGDLDFFSSRFFYFFSHAAIATIRLQSVQTSSSSNFALVCLVRLCQRVQARASCSTGRLGNRPTLSRSPGAWRFEYFFGLQFVDDQLPRDCGVSQASE